MTTVSLFQMMTNRLGDRLLCWIRVILCLFGLYFTIRAPNVSLLLCFQEDFFHFYTPGLVLLFYIKIFDAGFTTPFNCKSSLLAQFAAFIVLSIQTWIVGVSPQLMTGLLIVCYSIFPQKNPEINQQSDNKTVGALQSV